MNLTLTLRILGALLACLSGTLLLPLPFSFYYRDGAWPAFLFSAVICLVIGGLLFYFCKSRKDMSVREGFAIVTFGWGFFALLGARP